MSTLSVAQRRCQNYSWCRYRGVTADIRRFFLCAHVRVPFRWTRVQVARNRIRETGVRIRSWSRIPPAPETATARVYMYVHMYAHVGVAC